jgi:hypothetical protein
MKMPKVLRLAVLLLSASTFVASAMTEHEYIRRIDPNSFAQFFENDASYFEQFLFGVEGSCEDPNKLWFKISCSGEEVALGPDALKRPSYASLSIQLFPNHTY